MREEIYSLTKGLDEKSFPYQLFQKAKKFGIWNPNDIDFTQDKEDWKNLTPSQKETIRLRVSRFIVGEESVTMDILPMMMAVAKKGWIEEEMFLTTFVFEEAKHVELFNIFMKEIGEPGDIHYSDGGHRKIWFEMMPTIMNRLIDDPSPQNMAESAAFYNILMEGVQAETGYYTFYEGLKKQNLMPGLIEGIRNLQLDESRHISFGTHILQRLISEDPQLFHFVENKIRNEWWPNAEYVWTSNAADGAVTDGFGVKISDMLAFARKQLEARMSVLKRTYEKGQLEVNQ